MVSADTFFLYDAAISGVFSVFFWLAFPRRLKEPKLHVLFLLFCFSFFIPGLGIVGLSIGAVLLGFFRIQLKERTVENIAMPFFVREKVIKPMTFGESGGWQRAQLKSASSADRIQSMAAVNAKVSPQANVLNQTILQDISDELRLYAFSLLNKQGDKIDEAINDLKEKLKGEKEAIVIANLHKQIAMLYWELIYNKLVTGELLNFTIGKVIEHANLAQKELPEDIDLCLLFAKLALYQKDFEKARGLFEKAKVLGAPVEKTVPFLAEIYFKARDFNRVKLLFKEAPTLKEIPRLGLIVNFWCDGNEIKNATS